MSGKDKRKKVVKSILSKLREEGMSVSPVPDSPSEDNKEGGSSFSEKYNNLSSLRKKKRKKVSIEE